jgi:mono/diheme cytochrome c family protein
MGRNGIKPAATLLFVALAGAGYFAGSSAGAQRKTVAKNSNIDAHTVYSRHCATCHGEDGDANTEKGELYGATDFTSKKWWDKEHPSDARLRRTVGAGKRGGMPAFGRRLSAAEIAALVTYVRGFKGK